MLRIIVINLLSTAINNPFINDSLLSLQAIIFYDITHTVEIFS